MKNNIMHSQNSETVVPDETYQATRNSVVYSRITQNDVNGALVT